MKFKNLLSTSVTVALSDASVVFIQRYSAQDKGTPSVEILKKDFPNNAAYSHRVGRIVPLRPYFDDTHLRNFYSVDAGAFGGL